MSFLGQFGGFLRVFVPPASRSIFGPAFDPLLRGRESRVEL